MQRRRVLASLTAMAIAPSASVRAQAWPSKPITMYVPFPAGGPADMFGRILARGMSVQLAQQVVVENKSGLGGVTGVDAIAKAAPDGYTIGMNSAGPSSIAPFILPRMPFQDRELVLLTPIALVQEVIAVTAKLPMTTLPDLIAHAKANPGKVNYGSSGTGSITHLAGELFKTAAGIDIVHVPYRGAAPAVQDLLAGQVQMTVLDVSVLLPHIRTGAVRALAVTSKIRSSLLPDVPTTAEVGLPGVLSDNWYGLAAPAGVPKDILDRIHAAAVAVLKTKEVVAPMTEQGAVIRPMTPAEYTAFVQLEREKWAPVVKASGARIE
ncbi:tripartite tricarboxylate transporter substrate binding protein [Vineibacter terrae]|uniref:Bug family tripartite tricarboxylate transporter substrate binding protein n=1 Tax=Vineibacter terrae TaxID=2586908 RepID=UPI002E2F22CB|nr:tripartite tricarboxylate transporter substrate binding protein [Vineibacter terrae]HEX2890718.1 tripartite tricarboxylate transporter substrate binding protein [Vineibacter terrae]